MGKLVLLSLMHGNFEDGFPIGINIRDEDSGRLLNMVEGILPPNDELENRYDNWRKPYRELVNGRHTSRMPFTGDTNLDIKARNTKLVSEIKTANRELDKTINDWLRPEKDFTKVHIKLNRTLTAKDEEIRFIINTNNLILQRLPFFLWKDFFEHYTRAEAGIYLPVQNSTPINRNSKVKILAVFGAKEIEGSHTKLAIENDWSEIQKLSETSNAELTRLQEPTLDELEESIENVCPQVLFFAGHSSSDNNLNEGQILLNRDEIITIEDLRIELIKAAKKGLKLAIFNSCDGMGIARQLRNIGISNIIVMREPIPDEVAHRFLRRFLERFVCGRSVNLAVRRGKEKLQSLERYYPGVMCLPVLWQNPAEPPLTWEQLGGVVTNNNQDYGTDINSQNSTIWTSTVIQNPNSLERETTNIIEISQTDESNKTTEEKTVSSRDITTQLKPEKNKDTNNNLNITFCPSCNYPNQSELLVCSSCGFSLGVIHNSPETTLKNQEKHNKSIPPRSYIHTYSPYPSEIPPNSLVDRRYRVVKTLGQGGFGRTYLAKDEKRFEKHCVLKESVPPGRDEYVIAKSRELFEREAKVLNQLEHRQIPKFYGWFEEDKRLFLVQEFVDGKTYRDLIKERQLKNEAFTEAEVIQLLRDLLPVLQYIHTNKIIHRDISPDNIILSRNAEKPILIDFGVVNNITDSAITPGTMVGKMSYSPIEQIYQGVSYPSSDLYALAITAIVLLTGKQRELFDSLDDKLQWRKHASVDDSFAQVIDTMVAEKPQDRYQSAEEVLERLTPIVKYKPPKIITIKSATQRKIKAIIIGTLVTLILTTVSVVIKLDNFPRFCNFVKNCSENTNQET